MSQDCRLGKTEYLEFKHCNDVLTFTVCLVFSGFKVWKAATSLKIWVISVTELLHLAAALQDSTARWTNP